MARDASGGAVELFKPLRFAAPFGFLGLTALGLALGGAWPLLAFALTPAALCGLDFGLGVEPDPGAVHETRISAMLPRLYVALQVALVIIGAVRCARPEATALESAAAAAAVGVSVGVFGMLAAHDLVHRPGRADPWIGLTMLAFAGYMHFRIAHIHGHHVQGASREDPATARRGEGLYAFVVRSVAGQFAEAWRFEARRLARRGRPVLGPANRMLWYGAIELLLAAAFLGFGLRALLFWAAQAMLGVFLLEAFNYVAHYGLARRRDERGVLEPMRPRHSWGCSRRMSNWSMFNMGRHADHHLRPASPYPALAPLDGSPELPGGYAGAILLALAPPLWRKIMDPRADSWAVAGPERSGGPDPGRAYASGG
jgi:alkane 1-monooxygenase